MLLTAYFSSWIQDNWNFRKKKLAKILDSMKKFSSLISMTGPRTPLPGPDWGWSLNGGKIGESILR
jgi:hypothetical protein